MENEDPTSEDEIDFNALEVEYLGNDSNLIRKADNALPRDCKKKKIAKS